MPMTLKGATELRMRLRAMSNDVQREHLEEAALFGAQPVVETAKALAPILEQPHKDRIPGALKASIMAKLRPRRDPTYALIAIGPVKQGSTLDAFYARWVEFGTRYIAAQPFLRPAMLLRGIEAAARVRERLWQSIMRHTVR